MVEDDATTGLLQLTEADDVHMHPRNEVDGGERAVLTILAAEDGRAATLDLHHGPVPKMDGSHKIWVEFGEGAPLPSHVVRGP